MAAVMKSNAGVRFADDVTVKILPKQRLQMTSRERLKYWWSEHELGKILRVCLKDLEIVKSEHEQSLTSVTSAESTSQSESGVTARGLEYVHEDDERMKQKKEVVHCMVNLLNRNVEEENKKATKKFYKGAVKESTKRAILYGKLDELAVVTYLKNAEREVQKEHQAKAEVEAKRAASRSPRSSKPARAKFSWNAFKKMGGSNRSNVSTASSASSVGSGDQLPVEVDVGTAAAIVAADAPLTPSPTILRKKALQSVSEEGGGGASPLPPPPPMSEHSPPPPPSSKQSLSPILTPTSRKKVSRQLRGSILSMASPKRSSKKAPMVVSH